jgi:cyanophycin synthetase
VDLLDSRRLTGPNLVWDHPGALLDVSFPEKDAGVVERWKREVLTLAALLDRLEDSDPNALSGDARTSPIWPLAIKTRTHGAWLVIGGPVDRLYGLCDLSELAWNRAVQLQRGATALPDPDLSLIEKALREEANPALTALQEAAATRNVPFFWDDDEVSLGMGKGSQTWPARSLPDPESIDWKAFHRIPVAVITGTNGKSTNVRMLCEMASAAQLMHGSTSTDWIRVGTDMLDSGDYSGPGGARAVLRDPRVEVAVLETARGGMLRRGRAVRHADVALITNVAEDHMGQYGIHTVSGLAEAKLIVRRVVARGGTLVLNADDPELVEAARQMPNQTIFWFSLDASNETVTRHIDQGGSACVVHNGTIEFVTNRQRTPVAELTEIPITLGGKARYNVANSLSATAVGLSLGFPLEAVRKGLTEFDSTPESNPGRSNYFDAGGVRILLDYAHNVHGLEAILETTASLGAKRRILTLSTAGDRTESEIRQLAARSAEAGIAEILVADCVGYERELGKGGVPRIMVDELSKHGIRAESFASELEGARAAFSRARDGDLLILLVKSERAQTLDLIQQEIDRRSS